MTPESPPHVLLFDLGGVVIDIDFDRVFRCWAMHSPYSVEQIRERCEFGDVYQRYERGEIDDRVFFGHVRERLAIERASDAELLSGWNAVFVGQNRAVLEMIGLAARCLPSYAFTNTSASHQAAWSAAFPEVTAAFRQVFSSAEMGMRKPERAAFAAVAAAIGCDPGAILFFDDMPGNVAGARAAGLRAVQVNEPADVRRALQAAGVI